MSCTQDEGRQRVDMLPSLTADFLSDDESQQQVSSAMSCESSPSSSSNNKKKPSLIAKRKDRAYGQRAPRACRVCRKRKVRCIMMLAGGCCVNCIHTGDKCVWPPTRQKRYQPRTLAAARSDSRFPDNVDVATTSSMQHQLPHSTPSPPPPQTPPDPSLPWPLEQSPSFIGQDLVTAQECSAGLQKCLGQLQELPSSVLTALCIDTVARLNTLLCQRIRHASSSDNESGSLNVQSLGPDHSDPPRECSGQGVFVAESHLQGVCASTGGIVIPYTIPDETDDGDGDGDGDGDEHSDTCTTGSSPFSASPLHSGTANDTHCLDLASCCEHDDADSGVDIMTPADQDSDYAFFHPYNEDDLPPTVSLKEIEISS